MVLFGIMGFKIKHHLFKISALTAAKNPVTLLSTAISAATFRDASDIFL
jgi:hypothetical protein